MGEFGAIDRLTRLILERRQHAFAPPGSDLLVDTGDDAAAWHSPAGSSLFTTDTMVEGVHFTQTTLSWEDVGWKVMAVNVSDLAAMGGQPLYALVTLGLPPEFPLSALDMLYEGALSMAEEAHFAIVGGDMVKSPTDLRHSCPGRNHRRRTHDPRIRQSRPSRSRDGTAGGLRRRAGPAPGKM